MSSQYIDPLQKTALDLSKVKVNSDSSFLNIVPELGHTATKARNQINKLLKESERSASVPRKLEKIVKLKPFEQSGEIQRRMDTE